MSRSRVIGSAWEREFVKWWNEQGDLPIVSRQDTPWSPLGDIAGLLDYGWVLELKNVTKKDLGEHLTQAQAESVRASVPNFAVVYKKRGKGTDQAQVVLPLEIFVRLFAAYCNEGRQNENIGGGDQDGTGTVPRVSPARVKGKATGKGVATPAVV